MDFRRTLFRGEGDILTIMNLLRNLDRLEFCCCCGLIFGSISLLLASFVYYLPQTCMYT